MQRLVIVSNRVPPPSGVAAGGLGTCILDALQDHDAVWFGWNGDLVSTESEITSACARYDRLTQITMPLTERDYREHYLGFCNAALWPVHHCRLDLARFAPGCIEGYRRVNLRFAKEVMSRLRPDDLIWVQDYHLIPLGSNLRALGARNRLGFFLHIPFPPPEVLLAVPEHLWLLNALCSYDVVGFQTNADRQNFFRFACGHLDGEPMSGNTLRIAGRIVTAVICPAGIDTHSFSEMAKSRRAAAEIERLRRVGEPLINIIGVDRLDYTKGLPERLRSFRRLLELYPQNRKATTLMQIAPPSREDVQAYAQIRQELEGLCGEINGQHGDVDWTPVRYICRNVAREALAALYRGSQVGLVTPLRDGMNLVAKEYVIAQDEEDPGVLVLSRFAGAAEDLREALIVNPYDLDEVAHAIQRAITMPREERIERHQALAVRVRERDAHNWMAEFLCALDIDRAPALSFELASARHRRAARHAWMAPRPAPAISSAVL
ncbi:alpha,alpha-trehalose-phosphate synthase (UDP-forming) [Methylocystis bryophila]|uniref:Alpha,alpha-trehalose-phosphate synthase n=1 Tax=Methylocystis bryophila TaxID=655015 RepID=A0A1W6MSH8_9HYPH|nr:trehalose-6-phosphate synthase [Methylocystis bryophila]ARN80517.1 alpha,alpha-trehalose-phosphate synthase [Methylocystis bryophila]